MLTTFATLVLNVFPPSVGRMAKNTNHNTVTAHEATHRQTFRTLAAVCTIFMLLLLLLLSISPPPFIIKLIYWSPPALSGYVVCLLRVISSG